MSTARARCTARVCLPRSTTRGARWDSYFCVFLKSCLVALARCSPTMHDYDSYCCFLYEACTCLPFTLPCMYCCLLRRCFNFWITIAFYTGLACTRRYVRRTSITLSFLRNGSFWYCCFLYERNSLLYLPFMCLVVCDRRACISLSIRSRIGTGTECAGCRKVESVFMWRTHSFDRTVSCEGHTIFDLCFRNTKIWRCSSTKYQLSVPPLHFLDPSMALQTITQVLSR